MKFLVTPSKLAGEVEIPGSKSHTIRSLFFATLASGQSTIASPLESADTKSAFSVCRAFGAGIQDNGGEWQVTGVGGALSRPESVLDVANSGTTIRLALGTAALCENSGITLTGDEQIQRRPIGNLADALNNLGAKVECELGNGCPPVRVSAPIKGGVTDLDSPTSQYLTSLLINTPLAPEDTEIRVTRLNEIPYVEITLWWLDMLGIKYEREDFRHFHIPGRQAYNSFDIRIPGDFSSATFFAVAAAIQGSTIVLKGLDMTDPQGDKAVLDYLSEMGAKVNVRDDGIEVTGGPLTGGEFDMNATPDALPAMAVAACFASGETRLVNVPQARMKETDRIAVMTSELKKMGATIKELEDGLVIQGGGLRCAQVRGHGDHRVVMSLAVAGTMCEGETVIDTAESAAVTFPDFDKLMRNIGAQIESVD